MTKSNKNRGFSVICCTYSRDVSKECLEVRVYLCCALLQLEWTRFPLNWCRMKYTFLDLSSVFQCMVSFNALPFSLQLPTFCHFSVVILTVCLFIFWIPHWKAFYLNSDTNRSEDLPPAVFQWSLHYICVIMDLLFWHQFAAFVSRWPRLLLLPGGLADMFPKPRLIWLHGFLCHV